MLHSCTVEHAWRETPDPIDEERTVRPETPLDSIALAFPLVGASACARYRLLRSIADGRRNSR